MKYHTHSSFFGKKRPLGQDGVAAVYGYRKYGNLAVDRQEESSPFEQMKLSISTPRAFGKNQEGKAFLFYQASCTVYALFPSS
jgi:hypothetical protein